ncbi:uncharacterized protein K02A2.6-like [Osmia bicornis bicornis]|uniref:uncharacterized protein K02A2.6-like n=1 Tax=Osmia bicornis bicornis TaxID=1437191 RepID=UPI001EAEE1FC|nr:uncharacterized protein K02A2.6-like [Osmia bicornis bicornis]
MPTNSPSTSEVIPGAFKIEFYDPTRYKWSTWLQRLEGAFTVFQIQDDQRKLTYLLQYIGMESYAKLVCLMNNTNPYESTYPQVCIKLKAFFDPEPLETAEAFTFQSYKQKEEESIADYAAQLQKLSVNCGFGNFLQNALRNQFVFGLRDSNVQMRLLETQRLTFEKAVNIAQTMELAGLSTTRIRDLPTAQIEHIRTSTNRTKHANDTNTQRSNRPNAPRRSVQRKGKGPPQENTRNLPVKCFRCGREHLVTACTLDRNITCNGCGKRGHLQKVCFGAPKQTNTVETILILHNVHTVLGREKLTAELQVDGRRITFEVDSGAAVSLISASQAKRLFPKYRLYNTDLKLRSFCKNDIKVKGFIKVNVSYNNISGKLNLYIVDTECTPLLRREWMHKLLDTNTLQSLTFKGPEEHQIHTIVPNEQSVSALLDKYESITKQVEEPIKGFYAKLNLRTDAKPVFLKHRKLPFKLQEAVENEIGKLVKREVLIPVPSSEWATPIVPVIKKNGEVRICGDYSVTLNKNIVIDQRPLPTFDELVSSMSGMKYFSKIDLRKAYLQLQVVPEDQHLLTISTHCGLYKVTRLMYGIASAPAIWQRTIETILQGIENLSVFLDDIKIASKTKEKHVSKLEEVFKRLHDANVKINLEKCEFFKSHIQYCGYIIDANGIHKDPAKIYAIARMPKPRNVSEVRAFVGFVNYYGRFIKNLSTILYPLNNLLKKTVQFRWTKDCDQAFTRAIQEFRDNKILAHYDSTLPLVLATDASQYGVGAVLSHKLPDGTEKIIQCASQTFSDTQRKYAQIDKEAYAIIYGIKKFHQYLYGTKFTLVTDHRPLTQILAPSKSLPTFTTLRMQHYALFLRAYNYEIQYRRSEDHANADGLSRLPLYEKSCEYDVIDMLHIHTVHTLPVTTKEIAASTQKDATLCELRDMVESGTSNKKFENINIQEFSIHDNILLRNDRVVIPQQLRARVLKELHSGHFGAAKMKSLARKLMWWQHMDRDIEDCAKSCTVCSMHKNNPPKISTHIWEEPAEPFERVHADFAGPFLGKNFLILVDAFSKYPIVKIIDNLTTCSTIKTTAELLLQTNLNSF